MDAMEQQMYNERFARYKETLVDHEDRIRDQDKQMHDIRELTIRMGQLLDKHEDKLGEHERRLSSIEQKPVKLVDLVFDKLVTLLVAAVVGYFSSHV